MAISAARFPCATCAGRMLPPGLELITKEEKSEMAKTTNGNCTNCGRKGVLSVLHGGKVCNTCRYLLAAANNNIPALAGAVRTVGKTEEMIKALIPDEGGRLAVEVTSDRLREISGIVGYQGGKLDELVEAVRSRVERLCVSCEAEDVLAEIREIVGYTPEQGDKGLADAVRAFADSRPADVHDCADCTALRGDLDRSTRVIEELRSELTIAQQARDEWEQRAEWAEQRAADQSAELDHLEERLRDMGEEVESYSRPGLLDIAIAAMRGEPVPAEKIADLLAIARGRMA